MEKHLLNVNILTEVLIFVKTNLMFACFFFTNIKSEEVITFGSIYPHSSLVIPVIRGTLLNWWD